MAKNGVPVVMAISGRDGAGKSTLVRALAKVMQTDYNLAVLSPGWAVHGVTVELVQGDDDPQAALTNLIAGNPDLEVVLVDGFALETEAENVFTLHLLDAPTAAAINVGEDVSLTLSDVFVLSKVDLETELSRSLVSIQRDARLLRAGKPTYLVSATQGTGLNMVIGWIEDRVEGIPL